MCESWLRILRHFQDEDLDEILINDCELLTKIYKDRQENLPFSEFNREQLIELCQDLAFRSFFRLDPLHPAAGGDFDETIDGTRLNGRWHAVLPPLSRDGPLLSVRRHRLEHLHWQHFTARSMPDSLHRLLENLPNLLVIGPTGSGKTSFMMALLRQFALHQRIAIVESLPEIPKLSPNWIRLRSLRGDLHAKQQVSLAQVFDEILRLRPDRLLLGELRSDEEALVLRRMWSAGQGGIWTSLHADHPDGLMQRLEQLSGHSAKSWDELLRAAGTLIAVMQRQKPRLKALFQGLSSGWESLCLD